MSSHPHDLTTLRPPAGPRVIRTLTPRSIMGRLLLGAAAGLGAGFALYFVAVLVVTTLTESETWIYTVLFGGAAITVYGMPIVGALVALASMVLKRADH